MTEGHPIKIYRIGELTQSYALYIAVDFNYKIIASHFCSDDSFAVYDLSKAVSIENISPQIVFSGEASAELMDKLAKENTNV